MKQLMIIGCVLIALAAICAGLYPVFTMMSIHENANAIQFGTGWWLFVLMFLFGGVICVLVSACNEGN
jgi:hypothetical protein